MEKRESYSVAPSDPTRDGILSRGALLGVVAVALVGLALVFPKTDLLTRLRTGVSGEGADAELTIAYLRNLIRTERGDVGLRTLLIEKLIAAREFNEAEELLKDTKPMLSNQSDGVAKWNALDTQLAWARFRAIRERLLPSEKVRSTDISAGQAATLATELEASRTVLANKLRAQIPQVGSLAAAQSLMAQARDIQATELVSELQAKIAVLLRAQVAGVQTPEAAFRLMAQAREVQAADVLKDLLAKIRTMPNTTDKDLQRVAQELVASGDLQNAALAYFDAKNKTQDVATQREYVFAGVKALFAANLPQQAYQAALRELGSPPVGDPLHWQLVDWALAAGEPKQALVHLRHVVPPAWSAHELARKLDAKQLAKALDVALAGGDLPEAFKLAQAGLIPRPQDQALRERFAQVAEWAGQPQAALAVWLDLMKSGAEQRALDNVFRLAPMLYNDDALLAAWAMRLNQRALTFAEVQKVVSLYEQIGEPGQALRFLQQLIDSPQKIDGVGAFERSQANRFEQFEKAPYNAVQWLIVLQSELLERSGQSPQAIVVLSALTTQLGSVGLARRESLRLARLQILRGEFSKALDALLSYLKPASAPGSEFDLEYWDLRAEVAFEANRSDLYPSALRTMLKADNSKILLMPYQIERLLRYYLDTDAPQEVMALARQIYPLLTGDAVQDMVAVMWLDAISLAPRREDYNTWRTALSAEHMSRIGKDPDLLSRRAGILASLGDKKEAAADYRASLALREDTPSRVSYWWLLIDMADLNTLRVELAKGGPVLRKSAAYLEVQGAAWQLLGQWRRALGFYGQQTKESTKAGDYLWLSNYADVLESAGEGSLALRVRRHAFAILSTQINQLSEKKKRDAVQALIVRLRLSEAFAGGSEKARLAVLLGQVLKEGDLPADLRKQADDLIISWALGASSGARTELSRQWLWMQQARKVGSTNYAAMALALVEGDVQTLDRLMETSAREFQQLDQLNALRQLGFSNPARLNEAINLASDLSARDAEGSRNDELQETLEFDLLKVASRAKVELLSRDQDILSTRGIRTFANVSITPRLRLSAELSDLTHRSKDTNVIAANDYRDRELKLGFQHAIPRGMIESQVNLRQAFANAAGMALKLTRQISDSVSMTALLQIRQRSDDSAPLSIAGMQNKAAAQLSYSLSKDLILGADLAHTRYATQSGAPLGHMNSGAVQATYFLRREYPDWQFKAALRRNASRADGTPDAATAALTPSGQIPIADFFVPQSGTTLSLSAGWGLTQSLDNVGAYSRAVRPWGEIGLEHRFASAGQSSQTTPLVRLGVRGAVAGRDQLAAGIEVRPLTNGKTSRELRVQYEWIGDR